MEATLHPARFESESPRWRMLLVGLALFGATGCGPEEEELAPSLESQLQGLAGPSDDFDNDTIQSAWGRCGTSGCQVSATRQRAQLSCPRGVSRGTASLSSVKRTPLRGDAVFVQVVDPGTAADPRWQANFYVYSNGANLFGYIITQRGMAVRVRAGGRSSEPLTVPWDPARPWLRLRESAGRVYWERGPDGHQWDPVHDAPVPFPLDAIAVFVEGFSAGPMATAATAIFDNVNTAPPLPSPAEGTGTPDAGVEEPGSAVPGGRVVIPPPEKSRPPAPEAEAGVTTREAGAADEAASEAASGDSTDEGCGCAGGGVELTGAGLLLAMLAWRRGPGWRRTQRIRSTEATRR